MRKFEFTPKPHWELGAELGLFATQIVDRSAGSLAEGVARSGPGTIGRELFCIGINDPLDMRPSMPGACASSSGGLDPFVFTLFRGWTDSGVPHRQAIARGEAIFNTRQFVIDNVPIDLRKIAIPVYIQAGKEDHIAPWRTSYRTTQLLRGSDVRFVLSSSGHVAGIVNPPNPKSRHWTLDELPPDPDDWFASATEHEGSWWEDWAAWIELRAGERRSPPLLGSESYPTIAHAPGSYVHTR